MNEINTDKTDVCRLCLQDGELQSIFNPSNYAQKVMSCTSVKVFPNDNLPSVICQLCVANLNNAYSFKQQCEESDVKLRYQINNSFNRIASYSGTCEEKLTAEEEIIKVENLVIKHEEIILEDEDFVENGLYLEHSFVDQLEEEDRPLSNILKEKCSRKLKRKSNAKNKKNNVDDVFSLTETSDKLEKVISKKAKKLKRSSGKVTAAEQDDPLKEEEMIDLVIKKTRKKGKEKQTFECDICMNVSVSKSALLMHMRSHTEPNTINNDEDVNLITEEDPLVDKPYQDYSSESYQPSDTESRYSKEELSYSDGDSVDTIIDKSVCDFIPKSIQVSKVSGLTKCKKRIDQKITKRRIRLPDFCFYCEKDVHNFSRHVFRNHEMECEVQKILSTPKHSKERKVLLTKLRKKGNYVQNCQECVKPVKKKQHSSSNDYLPCTLCLGFYSRKCLWKHRKICDVDAGVADKFTQADAQNVLIRNLKIDPKLKELVFPRMRADQISLICKNDSLICAFGSQCLSIHREKHSINLVSRKMRDLGKLLLGIKNIEPSITNLSCALKPEYYGVIVTATKKCSKYDEKEEKYLSPSFAMNISTSIKQCCNLEIMQASKLPQGIETAKTEANLKTLIQMIEANWKFDVSSQAADDLNLKKWNKITIVPLATDLKLLKDHLIKTANKSVSQLKENEYDIKAYINLLETVFCRALLLNRRRPGQLKHLLLDTYISADICENKYEEFDRVTSASEKILMKTLKCVVMRGKRGRGVPVLFSSDTQNDITILIEVRHKYVEKNNPFLFATPNCNTIICGYKAIEKHARLCRAKNPKAISSIRLRKYLATLTQIFNMSENDIEQLANFMGLTSGIHRKSYRLPDDVFQTAKISKLLMLMEDGKADVYKGKSLDEIELNLDEEIVGENIDIEEVIEYEPNKIQEVDVEPEHTTSNAPQPQRSLLNPSRTITVRKKLKRNLVPWTPEQKKIVLHFFKTHIVKCKPPKKHECETLKGQHPDLLSNKDWLKMKVFIQNTYSKKCFELL